jgi:predicted peptidase
LEQATYDGFAKLVNQYENGNTDEAHTLAATKFITIVPIAPLSLANADPQYWYPECLSKVIADVKSKGYAIDWDRFHSVGYSMGAFSSWRFSTAYPDMVATVIVSNGESRIAQAKKN